MCLWPSSKKCQDLAFFSFILNGNSVAADRVLYSETHSSWDEHVTALTRPLCPHDAALCFGHCAPPALPMTHPFAHQSRLAPAAPTACATSALCVVAQLAPALRMPHTHTALYFFIRKITVLGPPPPHKPWRHTFILFFWILQSVVQKIRRRSAPSQLSNTVLSRALGVEPKTSPRCHRSCTQTRSAHTRGRERLVRAPPPANSERVSWR